MTDEELVRQTALDYIRIYGGGRPLRDCSNVPSSMSRSGTGYQQRRGRTLPMPLSASRAARRALLMKPCAKFGRFALKYIEHRRGKPMQRRKIAYHDAAILSVNRTLLAKAA